MSNIIVANKSKNILPHDIQREYIKYHDSVSSQELSEAVLLVESKKLFFKKTDVDLKKKLLYLLAHNKSHRFYKVL